MEIDDWNEIEEKLINGGFSSKDWFELGKNLKISYPKLKTIEGDYPKVDRCLTECLVVWLQTNKATYNGLVDALTKMSMKAVANYITTSSKCIITLMSLQLYFIIALSTEKPCK